MARILWTQGEDDILTDVWMDKTPAEIAEILGKTRNAIIGRASRLNLPKKAPGRTPGASRKPRAPYVRKPKPVVTTPPPTPQGPIPLIEATAFQCKAVIDGIKDENGLAMVCGKPIVEGKAFSFCSEHFKRFTTTSNRGVAHVGNQPINKQLQ